MATPVQSMDLAVDPVVSTQVGTAATGNETEAGGLAALGINGPLLLAQVINFLLLMLILRFVLYKPLLAMLRKRRETIEAGVKAAEESQAKAAAAERETAEQLAVARTKAKQIVDEAKAQAETMAAEVRAAASKDAEALLTRTRTQLAHEQEAIVTKAEQELGDLIVRATERVLGTQRLEIDAKDVANALRDAKGQS